MSSLAAALAAAFLATSASASLIPIGALPSSGNGIGSVYSLVTFQNTGTELGAVGVSATGTTITGGSVAYGLPGYPTAGGPLNEQTGSGNNTYSAAFLGLTAAGVNTFANLVLIFNGNEGGNAAAQAITLTHLSLNLFSTTGTILGTFTLESAFTSLAFPGVGNAGFGFQLDAAQSAQANAILAANSSLIIGGAARATGANSGPETVFISRIDAPVTVPESGATLVLLGMSMLGLVSFRRLRS